MNLTEVSTGKKKTNLDRLWKLAPDYVKLDVSLIQEAESNERVRKALPNLLRLIQDLGAKPIIEGIETQAQLDIALEAGGTLLQGYFLGKPVTAKELQPPSLFKSANKINIRKAA